MRYADKHGFYELNPFPGCNQLVVSNHAFIYPQFRGKGNGDKQHKERLAEAVRLGYDCVICTVHANNNNEKRILRKYGWNYLYAFTNHETDKTIEIWARQLTGGNPLVPRELGPKDLSRR